MLAKFLVLDSNFLSPCSYSPRNTGKEDGCLLQRGFVVTAKLRFFEFLEDIGDPYLQFVEQKGNRSNARHSFTFALM